MVSMTYTMPYRKDQIAKMPDWVHAVRRKDACLHGILVEAYVAKMHALEEGARNYRDTRKVYDVAEAALQAIAQKQVEGRGAWKAATDAVRKFTDAATGAQARNKKISTRP